MLINRNIIFGTSRSQQNDDECRKKGTLLNEDFNCTHLHTYQTRPTKPALNIICHLDNSTNGHFSYTGRRYKKSTHGTHKDMYNAAQALLAACGR